MPKPADEARQEFMRAEVLRVAERIFAENGIKHTSMGRLAEAMNLTRPALYHYFQSKQDIVEQTIRAAIDKYWIFDSIDSSTSVARAAEILIGRRARQVSESGPTDLRFFYTAIIEQIAETSSAQLMRVILDAHRQSLRRVLQGALDRGELNPTIEVDALVNEVTSRIIGIDLLWLVDPDNVDHLAESERIAETLIGRLSRSTSREGTRQA